MAQPQANENPVFQHGTKLAFAVPERFAKSDHALELRNLSRERGVFELVVAREFQRGFDVGGQRKLQDRNLAERRRGNKPEIAPNVTGSCALVIDKLPTSSRAL